MTTFKRFLLMFVALTTLATLSVQAEESSAFVNRTHAQSQGVAPTGDSK
ncbi:hypothetical protein [Pseudomonas sp. Teo4]|nr:hypothetical protein [Pseudomonas sp. Teo4]